MITVVDKPLIQYTVEEIVGAGIRKIAVITSRGKSAIEDHFDRSPELEAFLEEKGKSGRLEDVRKIAGLAEFSYIRQPHMLGLGHAILMGETFAAGEPVAALTDDTTRGVPTQSGRTFEERRDGGCAGEVMRANKYGIVKAGRFRNGYSSSPTWWKNPVRKRPFPTWRSWAGMCLRPRSSKR
jgi:UTP-glucose-1-phosphate uridylyltransferase